MSYQSQVLADGAVAYWRLEETSGTVAADATGSYPATYASDASTTTSVGALPSNPTSRGFYNATTSPVTVLTRADAAPLRATTKLSVEFLVRIDVDSITYASHPLYKGSPGSSTANFAVYIFANYLGADPASARQVGLYGSPGGVWQGLSNVVKLPLLGYIYHVVLTYDSVDGTHIYFNGVEQGSAHRTGMGSLPTTTDSVICDIQDKGLLDELAYYPGVILTPTQIAQHATNALPSDAAVGADSATRKIAMTYGSSVLSLKNLPAANSVSLSVSAPNRIGMIPS